MENISNWKKGQRGTNKFQITDFLKSQISVLYFKELKANGGDFACWFLSEVGQINLKVTTRSQFAYLSI